MTGTTAYDLAHENFSLTYFGLSGNLPGQTFEVWERFRLIKGPYDHAMANFAIAQKLLPVDVSRLKSVAAELPIFSIHLSQAGIPDETNEALYRGGFVQVAKLHHMVATPTFESALPSNFNWARSITDRKAVASFTVDQFFEGSDLSLREIIELATVASSHDLVAMTQGNSYVSCAMLAHTVQTMGLYSLCVAARLRKRGHGSAMLKACLSLAAGEKKHVVLQCASRLEGWYQLFGFRSVGVVTTWTLNPHRQI